MVDSEGLFEMLDLCYALLRVADDETVVAKRFKLIHRCLVGSPDKGVRPAAVFIAIVHQQVLLSQFAGLVGGLGDDYLAGKWPRKAAWILANVRQALVINHLGVKQLL